MPSFGFKGEKGEWEDREVSICWTSLWVRCIASREKWGLRQPTWEKWFHPICSPPSPHPTYRRHRRSLLQFRTQWFSPHENIVCLQTRHITPYNYGQRKAQWTQIESAHVLPKEEDRVTKWGGKTRSYSSWKSTLLRRLPQQAEPYGPPLQQQHLAGPLSTGVGNCTAVGPLSALLPCQAMPSITHHSQSSKHFLSSLIDWAIREKTRDCNTTWRSRTVSGRY